MVTAPDRTTFDHMAACELAEKRAIAVYGAVFALFIVNEDTEPDAARLADANAAAARVAAMVPRPAPFRVPTALERQQAAQDWEARR